MRQKNYTVTCWKRTNVVTHSHTHTHTHTHTLYEIQRRRTANYGSSLRGRKTGRREEKVEKDEKCCRRRVRRARVEGPWCPSAADVKLRVWSLPLGGPRERASMARYPLLLLIPHSSPSLPLPVFNGHPLPPRLSLQCVGAAVHSRKTTLWWTSSVCSSLLSSLSPSPIPLSACLALITAHIMPSPSCSQLSVLVLLPVFFFSFPFPPSHTVQ